ncbi:MAG TPA: DUF4097 family beta strand repeat-containing protein [Pyrinomonadaceae bacterium]|nr:DUF4097 family beta strand repeat-containing protein [Pyrinomonadaceae bacterium]
MKNLAIKKACAVLSVLLGASSVWATVAQERDEINRSFTLPAKAHVDVAAISGSVDIKAVDADSAIVQMERTARSRAELDCNKIVVEQASGNLTVRSENVGGPGCQNIQVVHRLVLSLPRRVDVSVHGVSGPIDIGEIDGTLRISGNSGDINLARVGNGARITGNSGTINVAELGSGARITGNSGTATIKIRHLDTEGLELSGNSGTLKLYVGGELSIDVKVSGHSGPVSSELPNVEFTKSGASDYYARVGSGGPTINAHGNSGSILLIRYP